MRATGCHGFCESGPLVVIQPQKIFYQRVKAEDVPDIIAKTIATGEVIERLLYTDPAGKKNLVSEDEVPFYKKQKRVILGNNGQIDPTCIEDYLAIGGYSALAKALSDDSGAIIDEVKNAGLRGRGGGGFPTGPNGSTAGQQPVRPSTLSATPMKATPALTWTGA